MTSPISGTCVGLYREHVTLWAKRCTAWASYPLVSKCIHCGSLKRWHANSSLQHARAAHITVAQVIYVEVQTNIFINKCILVRQLRKTWGRKQVYAILCLFFMLFVENSLPPIDNAWWDCLAASQTITCSWWRTFLTTQIPSQRTVHSFILQISHGQLCLLSKQQRVQPTFFRQINLSRANASFPPKHNAKNETFYCIMIQYLMSWLFLKITPLMLHYTLVFGSPFIAWHHAGRFANVCLYLTNIEP